MHPRHSLMKIVVCSPVFSVPLSIPSQSQPVHWSAWFDRIASAHIPCPNAYYSMTAPEVSHEIRSTIERNGSNLSIEIRM